MFCFIVFIAVFNFSCSTDILSYTRKSSRTKAGFKLGSLLHYKAFYFNKPFTPAGKKKTSSAVCTLHNRETTGFICARRLTATACCFYPWPVHLLWLSKCLMWKKVQHYNSPTKLLYIGAQPMCRLSSEIPSALFLCSFLLFLLAFVPLSLGPCDTDIRPLHSPSWRFQWWGSTDRRKACRDETDSPL